MWKSILFIKTDFGPTTAGSAGPVPTALCTRHADKLSGKLIIFLWFRVARPGFLAQGIISISARTENDFNNENQYGYINYTS